MNVNPSFFVIMIELLAVESLALIVICALYIKRRYQCKIVFQNVINATEATENARQQILETTLKDIVKEGDENTAGFASRLVQAENRFHKKLLTTFIKQDHEGLSRLGRWTEELLSPYRTLIAETAATRQQEKKQLDEKVSELEHATENLTTEKVQLNQQLDETKKNLDNIMSEYVSAFKKGEETPADAGNPVETAAATAEENPPATTEELPGEGIMVASAEDDDEGIMVASAEEEDKGITVASAEEDDDLTPAEEENTSQPTDDEQPETGNSVDDELLKVEDLDDEANSATEDTSADQGSDAILDDVDMSPTTSADKTAAA